MDANRSSLLIRGWLSSQWSSRARREALIDGSEVFSATVAGTAELTSVVPCSTRTEPPLVGDASPARTFDVAWAHRAVQRLIMVVMRAQLVNHLTQ
jgi:hypothetical protein